MIRPPLIVDENGDLMVFRDTASLELGLEAIDVLNGEYVVYDSEGRLVQLKTEEVPVRFLFGLFKGTADMVKIAGALTDPVHAESLATKIRDYLQRQGAPADPSATLSQLIEELQTRIGFDA